MKPLPFQRELMRRAIAFTTVFLWWAGVANAQVDRIDIWQPGLYSFAMRQLTPDAGESSGYLTKIIGAKLEIATTEIPGCLNSKFGFRYKLVGAPIGEKQQIKIVIRFPPPGLHRPDGQVFLTSNTYPEPAIGTVHYKGYGFDEDWEIVPGTWTFEIWQGEHKMAEQSFQVSKECGNPTS
jgi:hypothetical protein